MLFKGLGLIGPVKFTKFQSRKIIGVLSELRSFRNLLNFDAVSILKHAVRPQSELWLDIFAFFACFGVFERIIYIERTDVTTPFFFFQVW